MQQADTGIHTTNEERANFITIAQVTYLYGQLPGMVGFSVFTSLVAAYVFWGTASDEAVYGWVLAMAAVLVGRGGLYLKSRRVDGELTDPSWRLWFLFYSGLSGAVWGVSTIVLFVPGHPELTALLLLMVGGMGAAAIATLTMHLPAFYLYLPISLVPSCVLLFLQDDKLHILMGWIVLMYMLSMLMFGRSVGRAFNQALTLQFENMALAKNLQTQKDAAELANLSKSRFLAAASHDLRQPMHALRLFAEVLDKSDLDEKGHRIVAHISSLVGTLARLFDALLDISRLDAGFVEPEIAAFSAQELFDHVSNDFEPLAQDKGLALVCSPCPLVLRSDITLLERIVRNLVSNAIIYTEEGTVTLDWEAAQDGIRIHVKDTGTGIAENEQALIFEEFGQLHNAERDRDKGQGLGLSIVSRLCDLLDYPLELESSPGVGTRFTVTVPVAKGSATAAAQAEPEAMIEGTLQGLHVYLVDDDPEIRKGMSLLLESWGCRPHICADVSELIERLDGGAVLPDALIADYRLPGQYNGIEGIGQLHSRYSEQIPALLITGDYKIDRESEESSGEYSIMFKPLEPGRLRTWLRTATSRREVAPP